MTWNIMSSVKGSRRCSFRKFTPFSPLTLKGEFKQAVEKITNQTISDRESEFLFKMMDANDDGEIDAENELNFHSTEHTEILLNDQNHA